jgi:Bardet-Biedl syndrome 7 protein
VRGFNKKGKLFLAFDTNLTEPIKSMVVHSNDLIVCGSHVYNHYKDLKDTGSYLCGDTIVDVAVLCPNNVSFLEFLKTMTYNCVFIQTSRIITVLACTGRVLRILEHCRLRKSISVESVPTCMHVPKGMGDKILCGFSDGKVLLFKINPLLTDGELISRTTILIVLMQLYLLQ